MQIVIAQFLIERPRRRIETGQYAVDKGGIKRLRLVAVSGAQERRGFERELQMSLEIADQKERRCPLRTQLALRGFLLEFSTKARRWPTLRRALPITSRSRWNNALPKPARMATSFANTSCGA